ncbi:hypothetical protein RB594_005318 [Gaeumannomyces avenae]
MASIDRYRPAREGYQPPSLPPKPPPPAERLSRSPTRRIAVPPAVPSPPVQTSRNSPPRPTSSKRVVPVSPANATAAATPPPKPKTSQWFFTANEILATQSIIDGLRPVEERVRRAKGVSFIYQAGVLLELPQITLWVAAVFFHRFFMRVSLVEEKNGVHHYNIAATALFLANKTQEDCRKTKDLIISVARVAQKNTSLIIDEQSKEYWRWRDSILMHEEIMLEILTFDLMVDIPYQPLFEYLKRLDLHHNKRLRDAAWAYINDSCFSMLPLLMSAADIAASAVFFASVSTHEKINDVQGEPWWRHLKADETRIAKAIDVIVEFYNENPLGKKDPRYQSSPEFSLESTRRRSVDALLSQPGAGSSHNDTPLGTDRGTQSPSARAVTSNRANDDHDRDSNSNGNTNDPGAASANTVRESAGGATLPPSDAESQSLSARPNGSGLISPGIKRGPGQEPDAERAAKKPRLTDEDEGEVPES